MFYLNLAPEKFPLVNVHAYSSLLIAISAFFQGVVTDPTVRMCFTDIYYIDNLAGMDGALTKAVGCNAAGEIVSRVVSSVGAYLAAADPVVGEGNLKALENIVSLAITFFSVYSVIDPSYGKVLRLFIDLFTTSNEENIIGNLSVFLRSNMSPTIAVPLFSLPEERLEKFFMRVFTGTAMLRRDVSITLLHSAECASQEGIHKAFTTALNTLPRLLDERIKEEVTPNYFFQTFVVSLAFAGRCVPQLVSALAAQYGKSPSAPQLLGSILQFVSEAKLCEPSTFAAHVEASCSGSSLKEKHKAYYCHTCHDSNINLSVNPSHSEVVCCFTCANKCHSGHDLEVDDDVRFPFRCCCCESGFSLTCKKCVLSQDRFDIDGTSPVSFEMVKPFYNRERDRSAYLQDITRQMDALYPVFASAAGSLSASPRCTFTKDSEFFSEGVSKVSASPYLFSRFVKCNKSIMPTAVPLQAQLYFSPMCCVGGNVAVCSENKVVFISAKSFVPTNGSTFSVSGRLMELSLKTVPRLMNICAHPVHENIFAVNDMSHCSVVLYDQKEFTVTTEIPVCVAKPILSVAWSRLADARLFVTTKDEVLVYDVEKSAQAPAYTISAPEAEHGERDVIRRAAVVVGTRNVEYVVFATNKKLYKCRLAADGLDEVKCFASGVTSEMRSITYSEQLSSLIVSAEGKVPNVIHMSLSEGSGELVADVVAPCIGGGVTKGMNGVPVKSWSVFDDSVPVLVGLNTDSSIAVGVQLGKSQMLQLIPPDSNISCALSLRKSFLEQYLVILTITGSMSYMQYCPLFEITVKIYIYIYIPTALATATTINCIRSRLCLFTQIFFRRNTYRKSHVGCLLSRGLR